MAKGEGRLGNTPRIIWIVCGKLMIDAFLPR
jgi:hypothetical protein